MHDDYADSRSVQSYNFLISLTIAKKDYKTASGLLRGMSGRGIEGNMETKKLTVRYMLRRGMWAEAFARETSQGPMSLLVWVEFLDVLGEGEGDVQENNGPRQMSSPGMEWVDEKTMYRKRRPSAGTRATSNMRWRHPPAMDFLYPRSDATGIMLARHQLLMRHRPTLTPAQLALVPPRAVRLLVEWLLVNRHEEEAERITESYVQSIPPDLPEPTKDACMGVVNSMLALDAKLGRDPRPRLRKFLALSHHLRPNATTIFLVLFAHRGVSSHPPRLLKILERARKTWGDRVVNEQVLFFIARRAMERNNARMLRNLIRDYEQLVAARQAEEDAIMESNKLIGRPSLDKIFHDRAREEGRWQWLRDHLRRIEASRRRSTVESKSVLAERQETK